MKLVHSHGVTEHWFPLGIQTGIKVNPTTMGGPNFVYISKKTSTMLGTMQTVVAMVIGSVKNTRSATSCNLLTYNFSNIPCFIGYGTYRG